MLVKFCKNTGFRSNDLIYYPYGPDKLRNETVLLATDICEASDVDGEEGGEKVKVQIRGSKRYR